MRRGSLFCAIPSYTILVAACVCDTAVCYATCVRAHTHTHTRSPVLIIIIADEILFIYLCMLIVKTNNNNNNSQNWWYIIFIADFAQPLPIVTHRYAPGDNCNFQSQSKRLQLKNKIHTDSLLCTYITHEDVWIRAHTTIIVLHVPYCIWVCVWRSCCFGSFNFLILWRLLLFFYSILSMYPIEASRNVWPDARVGCYMCECQCLWR